MDAVTAILVYCIVGLCCGLISAWKFQRKLGIPVGTLEVFLCAMVNAMVWPIALMDRRSWLLGGRC